jgi:hypothetical protein
MEWNHARRRGFGSAMVLAKEAGGVSRQLGQKEQGSRIKLRAKGGKPTFEQQEHRRSAIAPPRDGFQDQGVPHAPCIVAGEQIN